MTRAQMTYRERRDSDRRWRAVKFGIVYLGGLIGLVYTVGQMCGGW